MIEGVRDSGLAIEVHAYDKPSEKPVYIITNTMIAIRHIMRPPHYYTGSRIICSTGVELDVIEPPEQIMSIYVAAKRAQREAGF